MNKALVVFNPNTDHERRQKHVPEVRDPLDAAGVPYKR